jgi:hypothetical protein
VLTSYLGTGYAFGILRLEQTFIDGEVAERPCHILVVTDADIFHMLGEVKGGWKIAGVAAERAGGGATIVLDLASPGPYEIWFRSRECFAEPGLRWLLEGLEELADLRDAETFVDDAERREELARRCLDALGLVPEGESKEQAKDRLSTLDSIQQHRDAP